MHVGGAEMEGPGAQFAERKSETEMGWISFIHIKESGLKRNEGIVKEIHPHKCYMKILLQNYL